MSEPKRRLGLMPEILPTPPGSPAGGPRDRTLAHMKKLIVMATAAVAMDGCKDGSTPGYGVVDPMPPPAKCDPSFKGTTTATRDGDTVTLIIEATDDSAIRAGDPKLPPGLLLSSKLEGKKLTVTFSAGQNTSWYVTFPASCNGKDVDLTVQLYWDSATKKMSATLQPY